MPRENVDITRCISIGTEKDHFPRMDGSQVLRINDSSQLPSGQKMP
jgi:hypothetical protein